MIKAELRKIGYLIVIVVTTFVLWGQGHYSRKRYELVQSKLEMGKILAGKSTAMVHVSRNERDQKEFIECHSNLSQ